MNSMKFLASVTFFCLSAAMMLSCSSEEQKYELGTGFVLEVNLEGNLELLSKDSLFLKSTMLDAPFEMALPIEKGRVVFTCDTMITPQEFNLYGTGNDGRKLKISRFFLENCHASVNAVLDEQYASKVRAEVKGCPTHDMFRKLFEHRLAIAQEFKLDSLNRAYDKMGIISKEKFRNLLDSLRTLSAEYERSLIEQDPVSIFAFERFASSFISKGTLEENLARYQQFAGSGKFNDNMRFKIVGKMLETLKITQPGCRAVDFTQNDIAGRSVSISDIYRNNKLTMLDFWASWCMDCRRENPGVVAIHKLYASKGLAIVGISLDEDYAEWKKAVQDDNLEWLQLSDLQGWKNAAAEMYCIKEIPQNILIDSTGVIVARNIGAEGLDEFLKEYFQ